MIWFDFDGDHLSKATVFWSEALVGLGEPKDLPTVHYCRRE
jgi:hypothetical protein